MVMHRFYIKENADSTNDYIKMFTNCHGQTLYDYYTNGDDAPCKSSWDLLEIVECLQNTGVDKCIIDEFVGITSKLY